MVAMMWFVLGTCGGVCSHVYVVAIVAQVEPTTCGQQMGIGGLADFSAHPPPMTEKKREDEIKMMSVKDPEGIGLCCSVCASRHIKRYPGGLEFLLLASPLYAYCTTLLVCILE